MLQSCYKIYGTPKTCIQSLRRLALKLSTRMQKKNILFRVSCIYHPKIRNFAVEFKISKLCQNQRK